MPFEEFDLHLFASDRGLVATPTHCSVYDAESTFVPWNDRLAPQHSNRSSPVTTGPRRQALPRASPALQARASSPGCRTPVGGDFSAFTLKLDRDDGDQFLGDLNFKMPPGFTGNLRGIAYCPERRDRRRGAEAGPRRAGRRRAARPPRQIGTTNVAAGPGSHPFHAVGKMYLAGPVQGRAALAWWRSPRRWPGPTTTAVVVVRVALHVDPLTAQVSAASDRVPSIIGGIPIRMRSIQVNIDKPNFTINPTNCTPFSVDSQGIGDQGTVTDFTLLLPGGQLRDARRSSRR